MTRGLTTSPGRGPPRFVPTSPTRKRRRPPPAPRASCSVRSRCRRARGCWWSSAARTPARRHPNSNIFLDDVTVSRRHAEFRCVSGEFQVVDVGSLNGTYVNREPVDWAVLANGDEVQIGKFRLVFLTGPHNRRHPERNQLAALTAPRFDIGHPGFFDDLCRTRLDTIPLCAILF